MLDKMRLHEFGSKDFTHITMDLEFTDLNVFTGRNGSGKSFIFKIAWFSSMALNIYKMMLLMQMLDLDEAFEKEVNTLFDLTFFESDELDGVIQLLDKEAKIFVFTLAMNSGKLDHFRLEVFDHQKFQAGDIQQVKYNSKEARSFEQYEKYLKIKKILGIESFKSNEDFRQIGEFYRIYDALWFEEMRLKIKTYEDQPEILDNIYHSVNHIFGQTNDRDQSLSVFNPGNSIVAKNGSLYVVNAAGEKRTFSKLSAGEQAILMLILFIPNGPIPEGVAA